MKVLLLNGSPRPNGCTYTALSEIASALKTEGIESEIFQLGTKPLSGCIACGKCDRVNNCCAITGDKVNELLALLPAADGLIIGSPVYYASPNGTLVSLLDRTFRCSGAVAFKPAAAIASARRAGTSATFDMLNKYFTISQMPIVSSQYWNMVHGNTPAEVKQDLEGMQIMRTLGRNMAWLLKCIENGKQAGIVPNAPENRVGTNFIR